MLELRKRLIPVLLLGENGLVKTRKFTNPVYIGDPVNTVRIFNDMEVDEIIILDICATPSGNKPRFDLLSQIAAEALFPLAYGGGIRNITDALKILESGFERIVINSLCYSEPQIVRNICSELGASSIVGSIDVGTNWIGSQTVKISAGRKNIKYKAIDWALKIEDLGVGEIMLNSITHDGEMNGYDLELISIVSEAVSIPVIACGGANSFDAFASAINSGAAAAAGGAVFVFKGKHRGVLIQYPNSNERNKLL